MNLLKKYSARLFPQLKGSPPLPPAHAGYAMLTLAATLAALWQHGEPVYTLILAVLTVFCSFSLRIPYRFCNNLCRLIFKVLLFGTGCFWLMYRLKAGVPSDKMFVETLALWNLTFLAGGRSRDYFYLLFNNLLLLLYAALIPRLFSLYMTIGALFILIWILFSNRSGYLSGDMLLSAPRGVFKRNWFHYTIYLLIAIVLFHNFFTQMPLLPGTREGMIPVSFTTDKEQIAPPGVRQWLGESLQKKNGPEGKTTNEEGKGEFAAPSRQGQKRITLKDPPPDAMAASGRGGSGGTVGKDLVFRVRSPLKLYHLAKLYDEYDGKIWHATPSLRKNNLRARIEDSPNSSLAARVNLTYTVEKWVTPKLPAPYLPVDYVLPAFQNFVQMNRTFYGAEIVSQLPALPYSYKVDVEVSIPGKKLSEKTSVNDPDWQERLPKRFYLRLPHARLSKRVKLLSQQITAGCKTPYAKAVALRDYLRSNYRYKLYSEPTPANQESCDYFLFHLQEGHCEYFAAALAVLARLNQLPARVATGFSPGNYNTLTGEFEVFEYHAHAWTQIYIAPLGWLTFDATPPDSIISDTTPPGFGKMRDPFGDEWRIQPPELTTQTIKHIKQVLSATQNKEQESGVNEALNKIAQAGSDLKEQLQKQHEQQKKQPQILRKRSGLIDLEAVKEQLLAFIKRMQKAALTGISWLMEKWWRMLALPLLLALTAALLRFGYALFKLVRNRIQLIRLRKKARTAPPREALRCCCHALLLLLAKHKMGRRHNQELVAYAGTLRPDLIADACAIFQAFYRAEYRAQAPSPQEAQKAAEHLNHLFQLLESPGK